MAKTHYSKSSNIIRHVRYVTKTSTRGPKVVKQRVRQSIQASPSKSRSGSGIDREPFLDDNYDTNPGVNNTGGKVLFEIFILMKYTDFIFYCRARMTIFEIF